MSVHMSVVQFLLVPANWPVLIIGAASSNSMIDAGFHSFDMSFLSFYSFPFITLATW